MKSKKPHEFMTPPEASVLDIAANRSMRKWSRKELFCRGLWETIGAPLFSLPPRSLWGWRRFILRCFGARIGRGVHIFPSVRIAIPWNLDIADEAAVGDGAILYSLGPITIGPRVTVSQYAHLCAGSHDFRSDRFELIKPPITVEEGVWICADAFVGPGVTIGKLAVVGARSVLTHDLKPRTIVAGNPAQEIGIR